MSEPRDEIAEVPRCPGCGSVVSPSRHTCYPLNVDVTQIGYRYLEGIWGYCITLSRDVRIGEDWIAVERRRAEATALRKAAEEAVGMGQGQTRQWLRDRADRIERGE